MPFSVEVLNLFLSFTALSIPGHALTSSPLISTSPYSPIHEICDENFTQHDNNLTNEEVTLSRREKLLCAFLLKHDVPPTSSESPSPKFEFNENFYLPKNYNKQAAPQIVTKISHPNGTQTQIKMPVPSLAYLNIRSVLDMNEEKEEVTLDLDLILMWIDGNIVRGLIEKNISVEKFNKFDVRQLRPMPLSFSEKVWTPDVFFEEVQSVRRPTVLDKTGQTLLFNPSFAAIFLRSRMLITLHCDMNFIYYPADSQKCQFHLRSDSYDSSQLSLRWWRNKAYGVYLHETSDPNFDYQVTNIREFESPTNLGPETRQGRTNCYLWFEIAMRRKMSYHLLQTYLPSVFFLIVTWLCFLIPTKLFEARVGVAMTTLLTQTSMFSSIRENTPVVGYVKGIDLWMVTCILFIFMALFAFTIGAWARHARERLRIQREAAEEFNNRLRSQESAEKKPKRKRLYHVIDRDIERVTVILLSLCFLVFATIYWTWLLRGSEYLRWNVNSTWNDIGEE